MSINREKYLRLKTLYREAVKNEKISFEFEGNTLLVSYAKYLIEYLSDMYEKKN